MNSQPPYPPSTPPPAPAGPAGGFFASVRRLSVWRAADDRWAAGVAAGIARRFGVDPLLVRGLFVVATLFGGLGLLVYGLGWMLLPEASDGRIHLEEAIRGRFDIALAGAIAVTVIGLGRPVFWWHGSWWALPWAVALVAVIAVILLSSNRTSPPPAGSTPPPSPDPGRPAYDVPEDTMNHPTPGGPAASADPAHPGPATTAVLGAHDAPTTSTPDGGAAPGWSGAGDDGSVPAADGGYAYGGDPAYAHCDGGGWSGGDWDGGATPPHVPPPTPPKPPVPGPGSRMTSLVLAVALLGTAAIVAAHSVGALTGNVWLIAGGVLLTVLGAGVLVSGLRGRTQGGIGGLALAVAILLVPAAAASAVVPGFSRVGTGATTIAGDQVWVPTTTERAADGYSLVAGELVVDLTELDADAQVPASVTFGNLHVVVPDDATVTVNARVAGGEVLGRVGDDWTSGVGRWDSSWGEDRISNGLGVDVTLSREGDRSAPEFTIDAEVTFGQIIIEEERS